MDLGAGLRQWQSAVRNRVSSPGAFGGGCRGPGASQDLVNDDQMVPSSQVADGSLGLGALNVDLGMSDDDRAPADIVKEMETLASIPSAKKRPSSSVMKRPAGVDHSVLKRPSGRIGKCRIQPVSRLRTAL